MPTMTTPEAVQATTGTTVTPEQITTAAGIVEAITGTDLSGETLPYRAADVRHLRTAVVWQAAHLAKHPDALDGVSGVQSASANGVSVTYRADADDLAPLLAPLAKTALRRLSWKGTRSVRMVKGRQPTAGQTLVLDGSDGEWKPLR